VLNQLMSYSKSNFFQFFSLGSYFLIAAISLLVFFKPFGNVEKEVSKTSNQRNTNALSILPDLNHSFNENRLTATIDSSSNYYGFGVSCFGGNDGWIAASGSGGTPPYTYEWTKDGNNVGNTNIISGLNEGFYNLNIYDFNGAFIGNTGLFISEPSQLVTQTQVLLPYSGNAVSCAGATDAKAYAYSWWLPILIHGVMDT